MHDRRWSRKNVRVCEIDGRLKVTRMCVRRNLSNAELIWGRLNKNLTNAWNSIAKLTYWTQYINPISCLIFLGSSSVINMQRLIQFLFHMRCLFFWCSCEKRHNWPMEKKNDRSPCWIRKTMKHCDNFLRCFAYQIFVRQYILCDVNKTMRAANVVPSLSVEFLWVSLSWVTGHGTTNAYEHLRPFFLCSLSFVSNYPKMSIDILKVELASHERPMRILQPTISTSYDMHGSADKCQKRYTIQLTDWFLGTYARCYWHKTKRANLYTLSTWKEEIEKNWRRKLKLTQ